MNFLGTEQNSFLDQIRSAPMSGAVRAGFYLGVTAAALAVLGAILLMLQAQIKYFPLLPAGSYYGTLSSEKTDFRETPLFVEVNKEGNLVVLSLGAQGWIPIVRKYEAVNDSLAKPLTLAGENGLVTLSGEKFETKWVGEFSVTGSGLAAKQGRWVLERVKNSELKVPNDQEVLSADNLAQAATQRRLKLEVAELLAQVSDKEATLERLKLKVSDPSGLKEKSIGRLTTMKARIEAARSEKVKEDNELQNLYAQIELNERVSPRGQAVITARRISAREASYYAAYWGGAESIAGLEELYASRKGIDLEEFRRDLQLAEQYGRLLATKKREQHFILELRGELQRRLHPGAQGTTEPEKERPKKDGFWDRIFG